MADDMKSLLSKSVYKDVPWEEYANAYFSNTEDDKKKSRIAMLLAMFGNMWEASRAYKVEQEVEDLEASGALRKAKYVQNAKDKSELLEIDKGIQSTTPEVYFDAPAEAAFTAAHEGLLDRFDPTNPAYKVWRNEKANWKKGWIKDNSLAQHNQRMEAWNMDTDVGFVTNANGTVIGQNLVEPKSLPKGHTWTRVEKMRNVPTEVYTNSANDFLRYERRILEDPKNLYWSHAAYGWATGDKGDPTLKEKIALEEQRFIDRSNRSAKFTDVGETNAVMASLSIDKVNDIILDKEQFRFIAQQTLADYPSLVSKAVKEFDSYGDDKLSNLGNAKAVLNGLVDNAEYETKKGSIEIQRRLVGDKGAELGWSAERIALEQDRAVAHALGISTAVLDKRLELTQLLTLAKEIGYKEIEGREAEFERKAMQKILRESFGDTTAERLAEQITAGAVLNYDRDRASGELDVAITGHLGDLSQKVDGKFIHRDIPTWEKRGVSQSILNEISGSLEDGGANWDIDNLTPKTTAWEALFNYKEQNYRAMLTIENSKGAVFAGSELSKELDKVLFKPEE
mgnify:CR=1 FL=1